MKKTLLLCTALIVLTAMTACRNKDTFGYDELIVGKWEVKRPLRRPRPVC